MPSAAIGVQGTTEEKIKAHILPSENLILFVLISYNKILFNQTLIVLIMDFFSEIQFSVYH